MASKDICTYAHTPRDTGRKVRIILKNKPHSSALSRLYAVTNTWKRQDLVSPDKAFPENRIRYRTYSNFADRVVDPFIAAHFL